MSQLFLSHGGDDLRPFDYDQAVSQARKTPIDNTWHDGFAQWLPIKQIGASLSFSCLAGCILKAAPQHGASKGKGSTLGAMGSLIDGDNR